MQSLTGNTLLDMIRQFGFLVKKLAVSFIQWLPRANWLQILVICVPLALVVTILPLVLMLFALFFIVKLLMTATDVLPSTVGSSVPSVVPSTTGTVAKPTNPDVGDDQ